MKRLLTIFILASLLKGILLYLTILFHTRIAPSLPILLTYLVLFIVLSLIDWKVLNSISSLIRTASQIKLLAFIYGTFVMVLFITGTMFQIHNKIFDVQPKGEVNMPPSALIIFLLIGLVFSLITFSMWIRKKPKTPSA